jgi:hypothetical protein
MVSKPNFNSAGEKELAKVEKQFETFDENVKQLVTDRTLMGNKPETEPQTKLAQSEIAKTNDIYLKPIKSIGSAQKFNEKFRTAYEFDKEYVQFIAENKEIKGEALDIWTRPYGGMPAEEWKVPTNKPVWGPRYLAEQIKRKFYNRLVMRDQPSNSEGGMQYYGAMAVDTQIQRLDAIPVNSNKKSVFMGAKSF